MSKIKLGYGHILISLLLGVAIGAILFNGTLSLGGGVSGSGGSGSGDTWKNSSINTLLRQSARWSVAATQDDSPIIALLHANYGAGYLWGLKDIATDREIESASGINLREFRDKIVAVQDQSTRKVSKLCPKFIGNLDTELLKLSGDL